MQEINLLQNRLKDTTVVWQRRNRVLFTALVIVLALEIGLGAAFIFLKSDTNRRLDATKAENIQLQNKLNSQEGTVTSAKAFQAQLKNMRTLIDRHVHWSSFFDELTQNTFNRTHYMSVQAELEGKMHLEGRVDSYTDLSKLLLGLSTSEQFNNIKLISSNPAAGTLTGYIFSLDLTVAPNAFNKE